MAEDPKSFDELLEEAGSGALITEEIEDEGDEVGNLAVFPDEPPHSGEWVDIHEVLASVTDDEAEEGRLLGEGIDPDDDDDGTESDDA